MRIFEARSEDLPYYFREIFVVEQNCVYQDLDTLDYRSLHVFYEEEGRVTACLLAFRIDEETVQVRMILNI